MKTGPNILCKSGIHSLCLLSRLAHLAKTDFQSGTNRIGEEMVSVLVSNAVDRVFEPRSGQTKDYKIGIFCFSAKHAALGIRILCSSGATCLSMDCCFIEQALCKSNSAYWSSIKRTSSSSY